MKKINLFILTLFLTTLVFAQEKQTSPILLTIDNINVPKDEFLRIHQKNISSETEQDYSLAAMQDYLDLFINFKLKVIDAKEAGCDTFPELQEELEIYRIQLAEPYLTDAKLKKDLLSEAYRHYCYDLRASHIVVPLDKTAKGRDTLSAYKKAMEIREKVLKGATFESLIPNYSEDFPAKNKKNSNEIYGGDLGYFSAFGMVYPFEKVVYSMNVGDISMPVRTEFGYHIIKLLDKQPTLGKIKAAHVLFPLPPKATQAQKDSSFTQAMVAFRAMKEGMSFEEAVMRYSGEKENIGGGPGMIPDFTANRMTPNFVEALFRLKKGMVSPPVLTRYGWHIIYLIDFTGVPDSLEILPEIEYRYMRDERSQIPLLTFIDNLKKEYKYKEVNGSLKQFSKLVSDSIMKGSWVYNFNPAFKKTLFTIENKVYTMDDLAKYIMESQRKHVDMAKENLIEDYFVKFAGLELQKYELDRLEGKYPEYAYLMQEYRDGVYLFEISNMKVWAKASTDTVGLEKFYEQNKEQYRWSKKLEGVLFTYNATNLETVKVKKFMQKMYSKKYNFERIKVEALKQFGEGNFMLEENSFEPGSNVMVDRAPWAIGLTDELISGDVLKSFMIVQNLIPSTYKTLEEIRGLVVADYQNYLEKEWVKGLRAKHKITVDQNVFKSMVR